MKMLRIGGELSGRCTPLIDADSQIGIASVQRKFDAPYAVPDDHRVMYDHKGGVTVHKEGGIWVATLDRSALTIKDILLGIEAINFINGDEFAFCMTPIQLRDLARTK